MLIDAQGFRQFNSQSNKYVLIIGGSISLGRDAHDLIKINSSEPNPNYSPDVGAISLFNLQDQPKLRIGGDVDGLGGAISGHVQHNNADAVTFQLHAATGALFLGRENAVAGKLYLLPSGALDSGGGEFFAVAGGIECRANLLPQNNLRNLGSANRPWGTIYAQTFTVPDATELTAPVIGSFAPDSTTIQVGGSTRLRWTITDGVSASIDQGVGSVAPVASGSELVSPSVTTEYTLTATNSVGDTVATATVTVVPATNDPIINSFTVDD